MIKFKRIPSNIEELLPGAIRYLESQAEVRFAYLFGGLAAGRSGPLSDIDLAVYLKEGSRASSVKIKLLNNLIDLLRTEEIDLVILNAAPLPLAYRVLKNKRILVDRDPFLRHRYESLIIREYLDFSVAESRILERRYLHG
jgi:predicted nucleotidyltransferase